MARDPTIRNGDAYVVADNMIRYGGHFASNLGRALMVADADNTRRIRAAFPELWERYLTFDGVERSPE